MIQTLSTGSPCAFCGGTVDDSLHLYLPAVDEDSGLGACSMSSIGTGALLLLPLDIPLRGADNNNTALIVSPGALEETEGATVTKRVTVVRFKRRSLALFQRFSSGLAGHWTATPRLIQEVRRVSKRGEAETGALCGCGETKVTCFLFKRLAWHSAFLDPNVDFPLLPADRISRISRISINR